MSQITVRGISEELEHELKRQAKLDHVSMNQVALRWLLKGAGLEGESPSAQKRRDLSELAGQWSQEEADEFDRGMESFERLDEEIWE